jgi:CBS domain containing-hemolysin-like protein
MPDQTPNSATIVVVAAVLVGAALIAVIGTFVPDLLGITGPEAVWVRLVFYAVATADVGVALWLRARIRRAQQGRGGTVQRR